MSETLTNMNNALNKFFTDTTLVAKCNRLQIASFMSCWLCLLIQPLHNHYYDYNIWPWSTLLIGSIASMVLGTIPLLSDSVPGYTKHRPLFIFAFLTNMSWVFWWPLDLLNDTNFLIVVVVPTVLFLLLIVLRKELIDNETKDEKAIGPAIVGTPTLMSSIFARIKDQQLQKQQLESEKPPITNIV